MTNIQILFPYIKFLSILRTLLLGETVTFQLTELSSEKQGANTMLQPKYQGNSKKMLFKVIRIVQLAGGGARL